MLEDKAAKVVQLSTGEAELPIYYRDSSTVFAFFKCPRDLVLPLLSDVDDKLTLVSGERVLVVVGFYEYRDCSIGAYNEVGLAVPVIRKGSKEPRFPLLDLMGDPDKRKIAYYVTDIPASAKVGCSMGLEVWGFPKSFAHIELGLEKKAVNATVSEPQTGKSIVSLSGSLGFGLPSQLGSSVTLSVLDGKVIRTVNRVTGTAKSHPFHKLVLKTGGSEHPLVGSLQSLGIDDAKPDTVIVSRDYRSVLGEGEVV